MKLELGITSPQIGQMKPRRDAIIGGQLVTTAHPMTAYTEIHF
jgi:hypothetical protein